MDSGIIQTTLQPEILHNAVSVKGDMEIINNSLGSLASSLSGFGSLIHGGAQLSQTDTLHLNVRNYLISNDFNLLNSLYTEHGIVQTLVDQPVDDAFRAGFEIKTKMLDPDDLDILYAYLEKYGVIRAIMQTAKWCRLFGGASVLIITDQDPSRPLRLSEISEDSPLEFRAVDMWELYSDQTNPTGTQNVGGAFGAPAGDMYNYYGLRVHKSRVLRMQGKEAPSRIRARLRTWGMSEVERLVRSLNQYMKNQDVVFELLDEAKVDIYKIHGLNTALLTNAGTEGVQKRLSHANTIKNYNNALTMDVKDEYEQKQIAFSGLAEVLVQIRQGIAADLKMPITKLFGISASGFNSGEDDIENYNSMIEGEVRAKVKYIVVDCIQIVCQKLFGLQPSDLKIQWPSLRILDADTEEDVKTKQHKRVMDTYTSGLITDIEAKQAINKDHLLPIEIDETGAVMPLVSEMDKIKASADAKSKNTKPPPKGKK